MNKGIERGHQVANADERGWQTPIFRKKGEYKFSLREAENWGFPLFFSIAFRRDAANNFFSGLLYPRSINSSSKESGRGTLRSQRCMRSAVA